MKSGKAPGCTGVNIDMFKKLGDEGKTLTHKLLNKVWDEKQMPRGWNESEIVPIYKQKGNPLESGNFTGIKQLEHPIKLLERILDHKLWNKISINDMQFGFRKGRGTIDAVFIV